MFLHILNIDIKKIRIKNKTEQIIKISRKYCLNQIFEIDCDNYFQIIEIDLTIRFSTKRNKIKKTATATAIFFNFTFEMFWIVLTINMDNMKIRLFNDIMIYANKRTI